MTMTKKIAPAKYYNADNSVVTKKDCGNGLIFIFIVSLIHYILYQYRIIIIVRYSRWKYRI